MELYRIMAIDYGEKRIGIALSDLLRIISKPYRVVANDEKQWEEFESIISSEKVGMVVIGLPQNFAGEDTLKTKEIREFATEFGNKFSVQWEFCDENFTSADANSALKQMGYSVQESRKVIDKVAASLILRNYLDNL